MGMNTVINYESVFGQYGGIMRTKNKMIFCLKDWCNVQKVAKIELYNIKTEIIVNEMLTFGVCLNIMKVYKEE